MPALGRAQHRVVMGTVGLLQVPIGLPHGGDAMQGQLLDQTILVVAKARSLRRRAWGE